MVWLLSSLAFAVVAASSGRGDAPEVMLRYALIVGNNAGSDSSPVRLPALTHAEDEARAIRDKLVACCNFESNPVRTVLLIHPNRSDVLKAASAIREQMNKDDAAIGSPRKLFAFFFTGHGLDGRLLLNDGPLVRDDLSTLFKEVHADFTIGVFDACYSASLDPGSLVAKGMRPTPGINVFRELPEEVLTSEGSVWFVSSGPDEASYEDRALGGVFTHYLLEAMDRAQPDGPGISLDRIWAYAQTNTLEYTRERDHPQNPQRIVTRMKERATLMFSFPKPRDATIVLGPHVQGTFLVSYSNGQLSERIEKRTGDAKALAVYAGPVRLASLDQRGISFDEQIVLEPGDRVLISGVGDDRARGGLGRNVEMLSAKGLEAQKLIAETIGGRGSLFAGVGYRYQSLPSGQLGFRHALVGSVRFDRGPFVGEIDVALGENQQEFASWGYHLAGISSSVHGGLGLDIEDARFAGLLGIGLGTLSQTYDDGEKRRSWLLQAGFELSASYPFFDVLALELALESGAIWSEGAGIASGPILAPFIAARGSALVRAF
jgi:caspase domain-containing protein